MKNIVKIFGLMLACFAITTNSQGQSKPSTNNDVVYVKADIHCSACKSKIEKNIPFEKGVKDVSVNMDKKIVTIKIDPKKTDKEAILKAFEKIKMEASIIEEQ